MAHSELQDTCCCGAEFCSTGSWPDVASLHRSWLASHAPCRKRSTRLHRAEELLREIVERPHETGAMKQRIAYTLGESHD